MTPTRHGVILEAIGVVRDLSRLVERGQLDRAGRWEYCVACWVDHLAAWRDAFARRVEPEDIRWVFISHDDVDHTGNVNALMDLAPNATLVINWFMTTRMGASLEVPPTRQRWVGDGGAIIGMEDYGASGPAPEVYERWNREAGKKRLPERVKRKKAKKKNATKKARTKKKK